LAGAFHSSQVHPLRSSSVLRSINFSVRVFGFALWIALLAGIRVHGQIPRELEISETKRAQIERRLTPIDQVLKMAGIPSSKTDSGAVLLSERVISVDEQGCRTSVHHLVYKTLTDAAVQDNSEEVFRFRKKEQKAYLLTAETIQPDGSRQPVKSNAILIQSPQRQAQYSLYDDQSELKVIFPNVKPGSITHVICVVEDQIAKMPGEFHQPLTWGSSWAAGLVRYEIDMPAAMGARLKIAVVGQGTPTATVEKMPDQRIRYTWTTTNLPGKHYDTDSAPTLQIGPAVNLTTIGSWDDIGRWYRGLLADRSALGAGLTKEADAWTAHATKPEEIIAIMHAKVADQVRYVGLEFGAADYQPHRCEEVWENQYGDCKDKANLLVALLRHRGIKADMALVNTDHLGLVDRRAPDFHAFNHAIVAVPKAGQGYLFCDPTIAFSQPGMLSPGSADRDVLVIADDRTEWVHTPPQRAGSFNYEFDLKLAATGELSGWMSLTSDGYYGAGERSKFSRLDADDARSEMSKIVRGFFNGADVVDVTRSEAPAPAPYVVKAYFLVNGKSSANDGHHTLTFPASSALFCDLGDRAERDTTYFAYRDRVSARASIALPTGFHAANFPAPFRSDTPSSSSRAQWSFENGSCRTEVQLEIKESTLRPEAFKTFYQSQQALKAWLAQPVLLSTDATAVAPAEPKTGIDLPMMPTADGEIELVDKRYPEEGNQEMRRLALERALQYFPKDKNLAFRAGVRIAIVDWDADRLQPAHDRLNTLLLGYAGQIKPDTYAWGEITDGLILRDLKRTPEAITRLQRVAHDTGLTDNRRAAAAANLTDLLMQSSVADALALVREIAALPEGATPAIESRLAHLLLNANQADELRGHLAHMVASRPDTFDELFSSMLEAATNWHAPGDDQRMQTLVELVGSVCPAPSEALRKASQACRNEVAARGVRSELVRRLAAKPLADWYAADAAGKNTRLADLDKAVAEADKKNDAATGLRLSLQALGSQESSEEFPRRLWNAAIYAEWTERQDRKQIDAQVCTELLNLCDQLPPTNKYHFEGKFLRARRLARDGNRAAEQTILREIATTPGAEDSFLVPACKKLGISLEATGDFPAALDIYKTAEPFAADYGTAIECLLHAALINLDLERNDEAIRLLRLIEQAPEPSLKAAASEAQIRELIALVRLGKARDYWAASRKWWPEWKRFVASLQLPTEIAAPVVPEIQSLVEIEAAMSEASKNGDARTFFSQYAILVSGARWQPSLGPEAAAFVQSVAAMAGPRTVEFRKLLISMLATPYPAEIAGFRRRQLFLAANYLDDNRPADALQVIREFNAAKAPVDNLTFAMHRVHGLVALAAGQELQPATAALEADLSDASMNLQRGSGVLLLADLYHRLGRDADEEQLLAREIANPNIIANDNERNSLLSRREKLTGARDFGARSEAWIKALALPWYADAEPKSLEDPRLGDLEAILNQPGRQFQPAEQAKLLLLATQDSRLSLDRRRQSLREAARWLFIMAPDYTRMNALAASVIDNPDFDEETRLHVFWNMLIILCAEDRKTEYAVWRKHPLGEKFNEVVKKNRAFLDLVVATDRTDRVSLLKTAHSISSAEITPFSLLALSDVFSYLLNLGQIDDAEKFAASIPSWKFASEVTSSSEAIQLDYARRLRLAKIINPVHEAFLATVCAYFPDLPDRMPDEYRDLRLTSELPMFDRKTTLRACLYLVRQHSMERRNLSFWGTFMDSLLEDPRREDIACDLLHAALSAVHDDRLRSEIIVLCFGHSDLDRPTLRQRLETELAVYRRPEESSLSYSAIRLYELHRDARVGKAFDPESAYADLNDPPMKQLRRSGSLHIYTCRGDRAAAQRVLESFDSGILLNPEMITNTIPAYRLLGMDTELRLATGVAERELRSAVVNSWATHNEAVANHALELARVLKSSALLPDAWVNEMAASAHDPLFQHKVRLVKCFLAEDWAQSEREAAALNRDFPAFYHFYWARGFALHKLGRDEEAKKALTTYTQFSKDEAEYAEAVALLKTITESKPSGQSSNHN